MCLDHVEVYEGEACAAVARAYQRLAADGVPTPFQRRQWIESWQRHLGTPQGRKPVTVVGYRAGEPVLILPLTIHASRGARRMAWAADDLNDYCGPIGKPGTLQALSHGDAWLLLEEAARAIGGADIVHLEKQPLQVGAARNPFVGPACVAYHAMAHATRLGPSWETYYSAKRSAKTRRRLKDKLKALGKFGHVEMRFCEDEAEARGLVARCLEMKARQLRQRGHWNHLASEGAQEHVAGYFADQCKERAWVAALFVAGNPIAISFGFREPGSWLLYQIAMDEGSHAALSPGTQLLMFIMRRCCELGVEVFDLSLGDEAYKDEWCEVASPLMTGIFPLTARGTMISFALRLAAALRSFAAARPLVRDHARAAKNWLKSRKLAKAL